MKNKYIIYLIFKLAKLGIFKKTAAKLQMYLINKSINDFFERGDRDILHKPMSRGKKKP